jgi:hypothetical protein
MTRHWTEKAFAKLKTLLRKAAERTVDGLWIAVGALLPTFIPAEPNVQTTSLPPDTTQPEWFLL